MRYEAHLDGTVFDTLINVRIKYQSSFEAQLASKELNDLYWEKVRDDQKVFESTQKDQNYVSS